MIIELTFIDTMCQTKQFIGFNSLVLITNLEVDDVISILQTRKLRQRE